MKHIQDLAFMKLAKVFALHEFWTTNDPSRKQVYVVQNQREAESIKVKDPNTEVLPLSQVSDLAMTGTNVEVYLNRPVTALLLYQGKCAIDFLLGHLDENLRSMGVFQREMNAKVKAEQDAHIQSAQTFRDQLNFTQNQVKHLEKTVEMLSAEVKKYEILTNSEKLRKKKDVIDALCKENEELKRVNEALDAQLQSYQHIEDTT
jgi:hypothetical protein